jgi:uncharacterized Tic20 family protein
MKENRQLLVFTHLSQLLDFVTGIGGFIVPLLLWLVKKDEVFDMDRHGKAILNFSIPFVLLFGLGLLGFIVIGLFYIIFPIINAVRASNNQQPNYPLSIKFLSY